MLCATQPRDLLLGVRKEVGMYPCKLRKHVPDRRCPLLAYANETGLCQPDELGDEQFGGLPVDVANVEQRGAPATTLG